MNEDVDIVLNESAGHPKSLPTNKYRTQLIGDNRHIDIGPCNKLFRRELFSAHTFDIPRHIVVGEDMLMNIRCVNLDEWKSKKLDELVSVFCFYPNGDININMLPTMEGKEYFELTIKNRLKSFKKFWGKSCHVKGMKDTEFYKELKSDMELYGYKLPAIERTLFTNENPVIRFIALIARGVMKVFKKR